MSLFESSAERCKKKKKNKKQRPLLNIGGKKKKKKKKKRLTKHTKKKKRNVLRQELRSNTVPATTSYGSSNNNKWIKTPIAFVFFFSFRLFFFLINGVSAISPCSILESRFLAWSIKYGKKKRTMETISNPLSRRRFITT